MAFKPTYEELEQRVRELERAALERQRAEAALRESEEKYRLVVENADECVVVAQDGMLKLVNRKMMDLSGYSEQELTMMPFIRFILQEEQGMVLAHHLKRLKGEEKPEVYDFRIVNKSGTITWLRNNGVIINWEGEPATLNLMTDITHLKRTEKELRESEGKYRSLVESSEDSIYLVDRNLRYLFMNKKHMSRFGLSMDEIKGATYDAFHTEEETEEFRKKIDEVLKNGRSLKYEYKSQKDDRYFIRTLSPVIAEDGEIAAVTIVSKDITDRKLREEALYKSEAEKRALLDASIDRIRHVDKDMRIIWANKTTTSELKMSPEDILGQPCYQLFVARNTPCKGCPAMKAQETGEIARAVIRKPWVRGVEGESYWDVYCVPLKNEAGEIASFIQIARNITDQKRAEERITALSQQLLKAQETERQRISLYLHDKIAQDLSTVNIGCATLFDAQPGAPAETKQRVSEFSKIIQQAITAVRDLSYDLRPPALDQLGLVRTVYQYCEDFSGKTGVSVDFHSAGLDDLRLDFDTEIHLYRLVQEGLNNIKKHAGADHVALRLVASYPNIILRIEDDGKGFDVDDRLVAAMKEKRMGIRSMEQRVRLLDGTIRIQSRPNEGSKIVIEIPYREKEIGSEENHSDR